MSNESSVSGDQATVHPKWDGLRRSGVLGVAKLTCGRICFVNCMILCMKTTTISATKTSWSSWQAILESLFCLKTHGAWTQSALKCFWPIWINNCLMIFWAQVQVFPHPAPRWMEEVGRFNWRMVCAAWSKMLRSLACDRMIVKNIEKHRKTMTHDHG